MDHHAHAIGHEAVMDHRESGDERQLEGRYANYFKVGHNAFEFVLDFGQLYPDSPREQMHTRIIAGPQYAKALSEVLRESLDRYEQTFGVIGER
jgi:uncharacterized protein DUF3467